MWLPTPAYEAGAFRVGFLPTRHPRPRRAPRCGSRSAGQGRVKKGTHKYKPHMRAHPHKRVKRVYAYVNVPGEWARTRKTVDEMNAAWACVRNEILLGRSLDGVVPV